jgi:hypothetical protein
MLVAVVLYLLASWVVQVQWVFFTYRVTGV